LKIFKSKREAFDSENFSSVKSLVNNNLPLSEKMILLRDSIATVKLSPNGVNELLQLLFSNSGGNIYFPRKGDNSERFDAIIEFDQYIVVAEVEIPSTEILDAPRNLLDDYAVLKSRKGVVKKEIIPVVICWDLPNKRTDYWNVVTDINSVLSIKIKTISILALALYHWTKTPIRFNGDDFYLEHNNSTMFAVDGLLNTHGMKIDDFPGYFKPYK